MRILVTEIVFGVVMLAALAGWAITMMYLMDGGIIEPPTSPIEQALWWADPRLWLPPEAQVMCVLAAVAVVAMAMLTDKK